MRSSWRIDCILALVIWIPLVCAAPAEHDTSTTAVSSTPTFTHSATTSAHSTSRASVSDVDVFPTQSSHPLVPVSPNEASKDDSTSSTHHTTKSHSLVIPHTRTPYPTWYPHTTGSHPHPFSPGTPIPSSTRSSAHGQPVVAIVFEVLAGAAGLFIVLALARCLYSYKRTPARDRIGVVVNRHRLEREMEDLEQRDRMARISRALEPYRWRPPPPPYQHAPAYDSVLNADSSIAWGRSTRPVPSHSPPPPPPPPPSPPPPPPPPPPAPPP